MVKSKQQTKVKIGKCDIMSHTDKDLICNYSKCEMIKKLITSGMYVVDVDGSYYHANCAKQDKVDFKIPLPKKRKKEN